jgi:hypothetical protein
MSDDARREDGEENLLITRDFSGAVCGSGLSIGRGKRSSLLLISSRSTVFGGAANHKKHITRKPTPATGLFNHGRSRMAR